MALTSAWTCYLTCRLFLGIFDIVTDVLQVGKETSEDMINNAIHSILNASIKGDWY